MRFVIVLSIVFSFIFSMFSAYEGYESIDTKKQAVWFIFAICLLAYLVIGCYYIETYY